MRLGMESLHVTHTVRSDLLAAAESAGGLTPEITAQTQTVLQSLCDDHDAVVLTCSTLGPSVDGMSTMTGTPVIRVDEALAEQAILQGGRIVVLCAVDSQARRQALHGSRQRRLRTGDVTLCSQRVDVGIDGGSHFGNSLKRLT